MSIEKIQEMIIKELSLVKPTIKQIVVMQGGNIVVGDVMREDDCSFTIKNCAVVRVWGTTKGLGELAEKGPTEKTILDCCPDIFTTPEMVIFRMNTVESNWQ